MLKYIHSKISQISLFFPFTSSFFLLFLLSFFLLFSLSTQNYEMKIFLGKTFDRVVNMSLLFILRAWFQNYCSFVDTCFFKLSKMYIRQCFVHCLYFVPLLLLWNYILLIFELLQSFWCTTKQVPSPFLKYISCFHC